MDFKLGHYRFLYVACSFCRYNQKLGTDAMLTSSMMQETAGTQVKDTKNDQASLLQQLTTESQNEASQGFDTKSALEIARIINHEDAKVAAAVKKAIPEIAQVIDQVARSLRDGGRLIYVGAGSSGRIAALDASECPPLTPPPPDKCNTSWPADPRLWPPRSRSMKTLKSWASATSRGAAPRAKMWSWAFPLQAAPLTWWPPWPMRVPAEHTPPPSPAIREPAC